MIDMEQKKKNTIIGIGDRNSRKFKKEREGFIGKAITIKEKDTQMQ